MVTPSLAQKTMIGVQIFSAVWYLILLIVVQVGSGFDYSWCQMLFAIEPGYPLFAFQFFIDIVTTSRFLFVLYSLRWGKKEINWISFIIDISIVLAILSSLVDSVIALSELTKPVQAINWQRFLASGSAHFIITGCLYCVMSVYSHLDKSSNKSTSQGTRLSVSVSTTGQSKSDEPPLSSPNAPSDTTSHLVPITQDKPRSKVSFHGSVVVVAEERRNDEDGGQPQYDPNDDDHDDEVDPEKAASEPANSGKQGVPYSGRRGSTRRGSLSGAWLTICEFLESDPPQMAAMGAFRAPEVHPSLSPTYTSPCAPSHTVSWVMVLCGVVTMIFVGGRDWSFGVYQRYYTQEKIFPGATNQQIAFIGSASMGAWGITGLFVGRVADRYGFRPVGFLGALLYALTGILAAQSSSTWHLILSQGLLGGVATGCAFYSIIPVLPQYFDKRRGMAVGMAVSGVGLGGFMMAPWIQSMLDSLGWRWALRIVHLTGGSCLFVTTMLNRPRYPRLSASSKFDRSDLDLNFFLLATCMLFLNFGFFVLQYYVPSYATNLGSTPQEASFILSYINISAFFGRIVQGTASDYIGPSLSLTLCLAVSALVDLVWWPLSRSYGSLVGAGVIFGAFGGGYPSLVPVVVGDMYGSRKSATMLGLAYGGLIPGSFLGTVLGGVLIDNGGGSDLVGAEPDKIVHTYLPAMLYGGGCMLVSAFIAGVLTIMLRRKARREATSIPKE
ncbi:hypothetical protein HDU93_007948 [Gonapodya sp. JEL0774]|nr:hypothetical protein HDU93_007948 [Gonapodya sp. JEL0774]